MIIALFFVLSTFFCTEKCKTSETRIETGVQRFSKYVQTDWQSYKIKVGQGEGGVAGQATTFFAEFIMIVIQKLNDKKRFVKDKAEGFYNQLADTWKKNTNNKEGNIKRGGW